ncbi:MAG: hypothetical protein ACK55Z_22300, partial [bacterium]
MRRSRSTSSATRLTSASRASCSSRRCSADRSQTRSSLASCGSSVFRRPISTGDSAESSAAGAAWG